MKSDAPLPTYNRPKSGAADVMSVSSLNKKSLKEIKKNLKDLVSDLEGVKLNQEESKNSSEANSSEYYSSKYFKPQTAKHAERKQGPF